ncbi:MAG: nickel-dependent hydrogenase large subunit [Candidatus Aenigmarchaeota archaeon]|nr:nickel-dependent hydrogenase large subunit [Candidatus Aenigmarchaeota archaeon]
MPKDTTTIPLGPQHPALVEPEYIKLEVDGESVISAEIHLGYLHRGIEELMQRRNYIQNIFVAERICGICSACHTLTYASAVESLLDIEVTDRAKYIRTIMAELERLHSHLLWVGVAGYEIGIDTVFQYAWKDREYIMAILEEISGNRVNYAMNTIGGVRRDITDTHAEKLKNIMKIIEKRSEYYKKVFAKDAVILKRTKNMGILTAHDAKKYSAAGPLARASNIRFDIRNEKYAAYGLIDWTEITAAGCDVAARAEVRIIELEESAKIITQCLDQMEHDPLVMRAPPIVPVGETTFRVEAPRGEIFYYARSNGTDTPERVKMRPPTYANLLALKSMLKGAKLADVPIIVASIDPCFSCTDRVTVLDTKTKKEKILTENDLRKLSK